MEPDQPTKECPGYQECFAEAAAILRSTLSINTRLALATSWRELGQAIRSAGR